MLIEFSRVFLPTQQAKLIRQIINERIFILKMSSTKITTPGLYNLESILYLRGIKLYVYYTLPASNFACSY